MRRRVPFLPVLLLSVLLPQPAHAQDATLEISETTLNRIVREIGVLSDGGVALAYDTAWFRRQFEYCVPVGYLRCRGIAVPRAGSAADGAPLAVCKRRADGSLVLMPGQAVSWQWWVSNPSLDVSAGSLKFTATVTTHIGAEWKTVTKTAGATARFDSADHRLKLDIREFKIPLGPGGVVDVARLFRLTFPIVPQQIAVPMPDQTTKNVTGRVAGASVEYLADRLAVSFDAAF